MRPTTAGKAALAFVLCALVAAAAGCKAPNLQDRMDDAAEMCRLNLGLGPGLLVNAHVTRCLALGMGTYEARRFGFRNGHGWIWDERRYDTNLIIPIWGWEDVVAVVHGGMPKTLLRGDDHDPLPPGEKPGDLRWAEMPLTINNKNRGWLEVSANVHLIVIGLEAGIDFGEVLDYALGWFGIDIMGDDSRSAAERERHDPDHPHSRPGPDTEILR